MDEANTRITIPEPTPEYWSKILRGWCKPYEEIFACFPLEIRIALYRYVYSCYPAKFTVTNGAFDVILYFEGKYRCRDCYAKRHLRYGAPQLQSFIDDLIQGRCPHTIIVCGTTIQFIGNSVRIFNVEDRGDDMIWSESPLCIELVQALMTVLELVKDIP